jgi:hypothetical protein
VFIRENSRLALLDLRWSQEIGGGVLWLIAER